MFKFFGKREKETVLKSPCKGKVIALEKLSDEAFSGGALGSDVGIMPEEGVIYSPVDGKITTLFPTLHAIGITTASGVEILIHIGINTVQLNGEGFNSFIKQDEKVSVGQKLVNFDMHLISEKRYSLEIPIIITNTDEVGEVVNTTLDSVSIDDDLITVIL